MSGCRRVVAFLVLVLALGAAAATPAWVPGRVAAARGVAAAPAHAAPLPQRTRVVMGLIPVMPSATLYIPKDKGYFDAEGIEFDWEIVQATSEAVAQLTANNIQLGQLTVGAALLNSFASGLEPRFLAGMTGYPPSGTNGDPFLIRKDLYDSGEVRDAAALRGRSVAVNGTGVFSEYTVEHVMRTAGLTVADVDLQLVAFPDMPQALANRRVDAAFTPEPFATPALEQGFGVRILPELLRGAQVTLVVASPTFAQNQPVAEAFMRAYLRGLRDLNQQGWDTPEHAAIIERYTRIPAATVQRIIPQYADPEARINWDSLMDQQRFYLQRGYLRYTEPLDLVRYSDDGPRQAALSALAQQ